MPKHRSLKPDTRSAPIHRNTPAATGPAPEHSATSHPLLTLQRQVGNAQVARMLEQSGHRAALQRDPQDAGTAPTEAAQPAAWDVDPQGLIDDPRVSPAFRAVARAALEAAVQDGLRPRVHEAYRAPETSNKRNTAYKKGGPRAAPGWSSCHNYGLAIDVWLYDEKGDYILNNTGHKGWYKQYKKLAPHLTSRGFIWGERINDTVHFEYHPNWPDLAAGTLLQSTHAWAEGVADAAGEATQTSADWMEYFWWAAGAGGQAPALSSPADEATQ